jgi:hypothetical protein
MNKFFVKVRYFFIFYKSKILKNKIYKSGSHVAADFKSKIKKYNFNVFWFMNNLEIFNYFFPRDLNKSFAYLEIGSYEGMSLLYLLQKYKNVTSLLTTHFVKVCKKLDKVEGIINCKMVTEKKDSKILYKYKLENGISEVKGGINVLTQMNYPKEIINNTINPL